jgi:hypothetical protein
MLSALTEGLAGVVDYAKLYRDVELSPRWAAAGVTSADVTLGYGASAAYFAYRWEEHSNGTISLTWGGEQTESVRLHLLLPAGIATPRQVVLGGASVQFNITTVESSLYLDAALPGNGHIDIR